MIFFTADLHLGHEAIIRMQNRPFHNVYEMNEALISNINEQVTNQDTLYILGDIAYRIEPENAENLIRRINGKKYLILGNHDVTGNPEVCKYDERLFEWVGYYRKDMLIPKVPIIMSHYPYVSWDKARRGAIMLHGHIHSDSSYNLENKKNGIRRYDVGVDANDYKPVSLDHIVAWAKETGVNRVKGPDYIPGVWQQYNGVSGIAESQKPYEYYRTLYYAFNERKRVPIKCGECSYKANIGNTDETGAALCKYSANWEPVNINDDCHYIPKFKELTCGQCERWIDDPGCMGYGENDSIVFSDDYPCEHFADTRVQQTYEMLMSWVQNGIYDRKKIDETLDEYEKVFNKHTKLE